MSITFQNPGMFGWLVAAAVVGGAGVIACRAYENSLAQLGRETHADERRSRRIELGGLVAALVLIVVALARPGWRPRTEPLAAGGRDVVFVLDVSRSMLAQDYRPDRLGGARLAMTDLVANLRPGDRVGLVVYAGSAVIVCPLTTDLMFFHKALEEAGPTSVAYGGTRIGDALRKTADKLLGGADRRGLQDVILFTDGGDQESEVQKAVEELNKSEAALLVIGLGSDTEGARIPEGDGFIVYRSREVWTRQESRGLEEIARAAKMGLYLNAGTRPIDLPDVYRRFTEHLGTTRRGHSPTNRLEEEFPWFLAAALLMLLALGRVRPALGANPILTATKEKRTGFVRRHALRWKPKIAPIAAASKTTNFLLLAFMAGLTLGAGSAPAAAPPTGTTLPRVESDFEQAARDYMAAARTARDGRTEARYLYNAATCWLQAAEQIAQAIEHLQQAVKSAGPEPVANSEMPDEDMAEATAATVSLLEQSIQLYETALERAPDFPEAARNLEIARARWRQAVPSDQNEQPSSDSDESKPPESTDKNDAKPGEDSGEMNDDSDESDTDESKAADATSQPSDTSLADLLNQNIPPPNVSPQDILRRELENNQQRSAPTDPKPRAVEKNW